MKNSKGILLTLLTVILFILMIGEIITYVLLNINYEQLASSSSATTGLGVFISSVNSEAPSFISESLDNALGALALYESSPTLRTFHFVNNSAAALQSLMYNGTIYGTDMSAQMDGDTLNNYINSVEAEATALGGSISITNVTLRVYQSSPFYVSARLTALGIVNSSFGSVVYPISAVANVSLNGTVNILSAEQGSPQTIRYTYEYPQGVLIGNMTAQSGSRSPFMFAYGTVIYLSGTPNCATIPAQWENSNYILATPDAADVGQKLCGMGGLVANVINSTQPLKPYLSYNGISIFTHIQNGTKLLIDGAALSLIDPAQLKEAMENGYYFQSVSTPSYLDSIDGSTTKGSESGIFSFNLLGWKTASFDGYSNIVSTNSLVTPGFTVAFWVDGASTAAMTSSSGYSVLSSPGTDGVNLLLRGGEGLGAAPGSGDEVLDIGSNSYPSYGINGNSWNFVAVSVSNGIANFYSNAEPNYTEAVLAGPYSLNSINIGGAAGTAAGLQGNLSNFQIYSAALTPEQISRIYLNGISGTPISNSSLYAWYPLSGTASNYAGNALKSTPANVAYSLVSGYTADPLFENLPNRFNTSVVKGVGNCGNINQCFNLSMQHLYLGPRLLSKANGTTEDEVDSLGINNGTLPNGISFEAVDNQNLQTLYGYPAEPALTIGFWVYPEAPVGTGVQWAVSSSPNLYWQVGYTAAGGLAFGCGGGQVFTFPGTLSYGSWHYVTISCLNGVSYDAYVNGSPVGSGSWTPSVPAINSIIIGNLSSFYGVVSDLNIYNTNLSNGQVEQLYLNNSVNGITPIGYWPLSAPYNGMLNETGDMIGNNIAVFYSRENLCTTYEVAYGDCAYYTQT